MTKFKSGDKVVPINKTVKGFDNLSDSRNWNKAKEVNQPFLYIQHFDVDVNAYVCNLDENTGAGCYFNASDLIPYKKVTKSQRITALENEVAELKLIVHELRGHRDIDLSSLTEPSTTNAVEDIIEFEGKQYRKVNREALEGDVVILNDIGDSDYFEVDKPYKVEKEILIEGTGKNHGYKESFSVYKESHNRTPNTVDVYELIVEDKPLTPNQQRAAIIEKAKQFIEEATNQGKDGSPMSELGNETYQYMFFGVEFDVNEREVKASVYRNSSRDKRMKQEPIHVSVAKCSPSIVFNEHIGKAITLGRALGLDVSEFEQAVQPTFQVGQIIEFMSVRDGLLTSQLIQVESNQLWFVDVDGDEVYVTTDRELGTPKIINDTNAIYGEVE